VVLTRKFFDYWQGTERHDSTTRVRELKRPMFVCEISFSVVVVGNLRPICILVVCLSLKLMEADDTEKDLRATADVTPRV
jgi:hypothetical protein